jgi:retron-type reverse transcriptase
MDFKDFFPSINYLDIRSYLIEIGKMSFDDARLISQLVCWRNKQNNRLCLSIGAPSSPHISNLLLFKFDQIVANFCKENKVLYTRYADDLAFSTNQKDVLANIQKQISIISQELKYPKLEINHDKTVSTSRAFNRTLVGLVLTPTGEVSLGREKKRRLRSELYRFSQDKLAVMDIPKLRGELAFAWSVDDKFIYTLIRQFGSQVFRNLDLPFSAD